MINIRVTMVGCLSEDRLLQTIFKTMVLFKMIVIMQNLSMVLDYYEPTTSSNVVTPSSPTSFTLNHKMHYSWKCFTTTATTTVVSTTTVTTNSTVTTSTTPDVNTTTTVPTSTTATYSATSTTKAATTSIKAKPNMIRSCFNIPSPVLEYICSFKELLTSTFRWQRGYCI